MDNFAGSGTIKNIMVGPMVDRDGTVRGIVHLINKEAFGGNEDEV